MKYNLTSNLILFRPVMKVLYIYIFKVIFYFKPMWLKLICQLMRVVRARTICFSERRVISSQHLVNFLLASVFCWDLKKEFYSTLSNF